MLSAVVRKAVPRRLARYRLPVQWALAYLWRRLLLRTTFIAVTGSVGKTTTKECIAAMLSARFPTAGTLRNHNDRHGVPRTILRVRPWHRYAVLEVATNERGLMRRLAWLVRPHVAVMLTVARRVAGSSSARIEVPSAKSASTASEPTSPWSSLS